uniref:Large ribosomal subunit protein uL14m n=1 Tax=Equus caballus TaxID=9796 RepID=A0A9L0RPE7_HORSE
MNELHCVGRKERTRSRGQPPPQPADQSPDRPGAAAGLVPAPENPALARARIPAPGRPRGYLAPGARDKIKETEAIGLGDPGIQNSGAGAAGSQSGGGLMGRSWNPGGAQSGRAPGPGSTTGSLSAIQKMTRVRVVDNSALGNTPYHRPPRCIHVYNKNGVGKVGDRILLAIKGQKKKALIVGHRMPGPRMTPRFDSNNVVLIEDNGNPVGTRIKTPIPTSLRQREGEFSKVLAIAQNFV